MKTKHKTGKYIKCQICNKEFYIPKNRFLSAKFCSPKCRGESSKHLFFTKCIICNNEFSFIACRQEKAKYCSRKCYYKAMSQKGTIIKNCIYCKKEFKTSPYKNKKYCSNECKNIDKINIYSPKSFTSIRKYFVYRNFIKECQDCGYNKIKSILGIHHNDENRNNNSIENLIVLCPNCHSLRHNKHITHCSP